MLKIGKTLVSDKTLEILYKYHFQDGFKLISNIGEQRVKLYEALMKIMLLQKDIKGNDLMLRKFITQFQLTCQAIARNGNNPQAVLLSLTDLNYDILGCLQSINRYTHRLHPADAYSAGPFELFIKALTNMGYFKLLSQSVVLI